MLTGSRRRSWWPFGQLAISRPAFFGLGTRSRQTPLTPFFAGACAFRRSTPQGPLLPPSRQRRRLLRPKVPSIDECVPRSGRLRGHERESARHLGAALPPLLGFRRPLFAIASRLRAWLRPTPDSVVPEPGYPFRLRFIEPCGPMSLCRGVWRRSSTSAITSNPRAQPSNRPIPAGSIASIDAVFARAGRTRALSKAETLVDLSLLVTGLLPSNQGPVAFAFAMHQRDRCASGAFARSSPQLRSYPDFDVCKHLSSQSAWRVRELETPFLAGALGCRRAYPEPGSSASTREPSPARGARAS